MPGFSLQAALSAFSAGQQINADLDNKRTNNQLKLAEISQMKLSQQQQTQQMELQKQQQAALAKLMSGHDEEQQAQQVEDGTAPNVQQAKSLTDEAKRYRDIGKTFAAVDPAKTEAFFKMADSVDARREKLELQNTKIEQKRTSDLASYAGAVLEGNVSPADAFSWVKDHVGLKEAMSIPTNPTEAKAYWRAKQLQGMTASEQAANSARIAEQTQRAKDREADRKDREQNHKDLESDKAQMREVLKNSKAKAAEEKAERKAEAATARAFRETEQLNHDIAKQAKPLLDDKGRIDEIEGLLKVNTSAADQQVHQALTSLLGNFKGRATNLYYKDNKNFGSVASRLTGFLSHAFAGRYQESDRLMIQQMLEGLKSNTIEPGLAAIERRGKEKAKGFNLPDDQVSLDADFNRDAKAPSQQYSEGTIAKNPTTGETLVYKEGKWVKQ